MLILKKLLIKLKKKLNNTTSLLPNNTLLKKVVTIICAHTGCDNSRIYHRDSNEKMPQSQPYVEARRLIRYWIFINYRNLTLKQIAELTGETRHEYAIHSIRTADGMMKVNPNYKKRIDELFDKIKNDEKNKQLVG